MVMTLTAETAQHYLEIIKLLNGQWLLQGPLTSHQWLRLSATPYYFFFPIFYLFKFHPLTLAYVTIIIALILLPLNYFVIRKIFGRETAFASTLILFVSPTYSNLVKLPSFFNFVIPLTYWLVLVLWGIVKKKKADIWLVFLIVSLMSTLHAAALMLLIFFTGLFIFLKKFDLKQSVLSLLAFLVPQIPFFVNDYFDKFSMTINLLLWIPYKLMNFLTGNTVGLDRRPVPDQTLKYVLDFFNLSQINNFGWLIGLIFLFALSLYFFKKKVSLFENILFYWLIFGTLVLIIHKNPPSHYFVPFAIIPIILFARLVVHVNKKITLLVLSLLVIFSFFNLIKKQPFSPEFISYQTEEKICQTIIKDAAGKKFAFTRKGPFDNYEDQFKQNYEYILWWLGNRPVTKARLNYKIIENDGEIIVMKNNRLLVNIPRSN
ncbi:hypothetical protein M1328_03975 [Patescibacteria group bacterium]|nr:hypothetical protein [Patescibacteria group bacterium]